MKKKIKKIDHIVSLHTQMRIRNNFLNPIFKFISRTGDGGFIWLSISLILAKFNRTRKAAFAIILSQIFSVIINNGIVKNTIGRSRPFHSIGELEAVIDEPKDYSFPSGHTASSFASAYIIKKCFGIKFGILAYFYACLMGASRIYLGVHYLTDVLCGALSGTICGSMAFKNIMKNK